MNVESAKLLPGSAVWGAIKVSIGICKEEYDELKAALAIVYKYEKAAIQAIKHEYNQDPKGSEWCEISYGVKKDRVLVTVRDGMSG